MVPIPEQYRTPTGEVRTRGDAGRVLGLHLRARRADAARRRAAALRRGARLPDGQREHGVRAVGADGRDEGGVRQRRQRSSTSCSSSTTRRGRRRSPRNCRKSSAARRRSDARITMRPTDRRACAYEANQREHAATNLKDTNMSQGTIVQCIGAVVDVEFPRDDDAQDLRRAQDGRDRADARSAAAAGRRRRAHDRARQLRRPAPRHAGRQHRRRRSRCRSAPRRWAGSWTCWAARSTSAGPVDAAKTMVDPPHRADVRGALAVAGAARDRHQGHRPHLPVRQGRQGRASSAAPAWARPSR